MNGGRSPLPVRDSKKTWRHPANASSNLARPIAIRGVPQRSAGGKSVCVPSTDFRYTNALVATLQMERMSLEDDLQEIDGVGEATAAKILAVLDESDEYDTVDVEAFKDGYSYFKEEQYGYADKFFKRVLE